MAGINVFSDTSIQTLREIVSWYRDMKRLPVNPEHRVHAPQIFQAPEVYIALPPEGGIPGLDETGTGTGTGSGAEDTPGSAVCSIWKIGSSGVLQSMNFSKTVYNLSREEIPQTIDGINQNWIKVTRTKPGKWIADISSTENGFDRCNALLVQDIPITGTGSDTIYVDNVVVTMGVSPVESSGEQLAVENDFNWEATEGAFCKIEYNHTDEVWELYQVDGCSNA